MFFVCDYQANISFPHVHQILIQKKKKNFIETPPKKITKVNRNPCIIQNLKIYISLFSLNCKHTRWSFFNANDHKKQEKLNLMLNHNPLHVNPPYTS